MKAGGPLGVSGATTIARSAGNDAFGRFMAERDAEDGTIATPERPRILARHPGGGGATATQDPPAGTGAGGPLEEWRATGNLRGNPPVREGKPPSTDVVEDDAAYQKALGRAKAQLIRQKARADGFLDKTKTRVTDFRYFFAKVYSLVTEHEIAFAERHAYHYPTYVLRCVEYFEQIYADNLKAFDEHGPVEHHWKRAFERAATAQQRVEGMRALASNPGVALTGLGGLAQLGSMATAMIEGGQALTESMKAHIRYDLPRAEVWVFNSHYAGMNGVQPGHFETDFMSMAGVFDNAGRTMQTDMAQKLGVPLDLVPTLMQDTAMRQIFDADMGTERADTWRRAMELQAEGGGTGPYTDKPDGSGLQGNVTSSDNMSPIENLSNPALRPSMDASMEYDDDTARAEANSLSEADLAKKPSIQRTQMLRACFKGSTTNADEDAMLKVMRASVAAGDLVTVMDGADAWDMAYALDFSQFTKLREILQQHYYAQTAQVTAQRLCERCMDGETAEWEEQMVADIIVARSDRRALIAAMGARYGGRATGPDKDFKNGLNKIEWQLDGEDQSRVKAVVGESGMGVTEGLFGLF